MNASGQSIRHAQPSGIGMTLSSSMFHTLELHNCKSISQSHNVLMSLNFLLGLIHGYSGMHVACGPWIGHSWNECLECSRDRGSEKEQVPLYTCVSDTGVEPEILPTNSATDLLLTSDDTMKMVPKWSLILAWGIFEDNRLGELWCFILKIWTAYLIGSFKVSHDHLYLISPGKARGKEVSCHWGRYSEVTKGQALWLRLKQNDHIHTRWGIREGRTRSTCKCLYSGQSDKVDLCHRQHVIIILCILLPQCKGLLSGVGSLFLPWAPRIKLRLSSKHRQKSILPTEHLIKP